MEDQPAKIHRRKLPWLLGIIVLGTLALLVVLQSTNLWKTFTIESSSDLLLLYALSSLNFAAFMVFAFIFLRSIVKLVRERRTFQLGAQIKTRLLIYFFALSLLPIMAMAGFSYLFMNRALERWFSQIPQNVLRGAKEMQRSSANDRISRIEGTARMLALTLASKDVSDDVLTRLSVEGRLSYVELTSNGQTAASASREIAAEHRSELGLIVERFRKGMDDPAFTDGIGLDAAVSTLADGRRLLIVPDPIGAAQVGLTADKALSELDSLSQQQITIRRVGLLTLGVLTFLLIFASSWVAFYLARGLTAPIKALAEGAGEIAKGNLGHRVDVLAEDELAILVTAFNDMSAKLAKSSAELSERKRYIETVLDSLPTGVVSFGPDQRVTTINDAAIDILRLDGIIDAGTDLDDIARYSGAESIAMLVARARRIGHASGQAVLRENSATGGRTVAFTVSALNEGGGIVLVIEDLSELIAAQRASAWQEVARRMAHEIKNPLTPIRLSAERIARRFDQAATESSTPRTDAGEVVSESTRTILREVGSLKAMVDEFSRFARLPEAKLERGDLKEVIRQALSGYNGLHSDISIEFLENGDLPEIMQDAEQLKRVFVNLIDNSVEAFERSGDEKRIVVTARHDAARELIVAEVSDNGRGIEPSDLQKLFLPYFSTKGRGTGLGLAIVKRIVAEHNGRINVVSNQPKGAKFTIELPVYINAQPGSDS